MQQFRRPHDTEDEISIIQQTDVDAKVAKRSAAAIGYLHDPFISDFVPNFDRRSPIINRGNESNENRAYE
jgi:hypothetical protein